ncbi:unnamed protein product [Hymenolepis diminuta]|uniref:Uncharacterized protein n=1 Tax=Hymenolepis diminuta TaxID=6216 RepID=A0A564YBN8_HYMDI|nr:unnamed protein product [Hymenolepis diminuta]
MIQQNASELGYIRRIAQPFRKKNRQGNISNKKFPSPCCYMVKCTISDIVVTKITDVLSVERMDAKKLNARAIKRPFKEIEDY